MVVIVFLTCEFIEAFLLLLYFLEGIRLDLYLDVTEVGNLGNHTIGNFLVLVNKLGEWNYSEKAWTSQLKQSCNWNNHSSSDDAGAPFAS